MNRLYFLSDNKIWGGWGTEAEFTFLFSCSFLEVTLIYVVCLSVGGKPMKFSQTLLKCLEIIDGA